MVAVGRVSSFRAVDRFDEATTYIRDIGEAEIKHKTVLSLYYICRAV